MKDLMKKEDREIMPDKISGKSSDKLSKIKEFRKKVSDDFYMDHAIGKIASDLSRYLIK